IRRPDETIRCVVNSLKRFRPVAVKHGVADEWIGRVEKTLIDNLKSWGEWDDKSQFSTAEINGHVVENMRIEETYKGNYHLYANIDGKERKFVVSKNKDEFSLIKETGLANLTNNQLKAMVIKFFKI
ncbi:MAG: type II toxin-antitoxin system HipA family toxin, partial [Bacteroidaceae bacterium]|nr:type II toxin-antitoxin system HipA family toxin [Bacteroidaceae bacterium]